MSILKTKNGIQKRSEARNIAQSISPMLSKVNELRRHLNTILSKSDKNGFFSQCVNQMKE